MPGHDEPASDIRRADPEGRASHRRNAAGGKYPLDFVQVNYGLGGRLAVQTVLKAAAARGVAVVANISLGGRGSQQLQAAQHPSTAHRRQPASRHRRVAGCRHAPAHGTVPGFAALSAC
jgi:aryl-alcohol dehydrogenase-like predicted oxidoreductase